MYSLSSPTPPGPLGWLNSVQPRTSPWVWTEHDDAHILLREAGDAGPGQPGGDTIFTTLVPSNRKRKQPGLDQLGSAPDLQNTCQLINCQRYRAAI